MTEKVIGLVRREASVQECLKLGIVDEATLDSSAALREADLVILGTPIAQMRSLASVFAPLIKPGTIVTDVGSVKGKLVSDLEATFAQHRIHFVGSHPMAGSEKTGPSAARSDLFVQSVCVLTPTLKSNVKAVKKVAAFWSKLGCRILYFDTHNHDEYVAYSSHLPHLVACLLALRVLNPKQPREISQLCAGGFRDTTRIASSSPEMWTDIALENRQNLIRALKDYSGDLKRLTALLKNKNTRGLNRFFALTKERRDAWENSKNTTSFE